MDDSEFPERRKYPRKKIDFPVVLKKLGTINNENYPDAFNKELSARSVDISSGGMQVKHNKPISINEMLKLTIEPDSSVIIAPIGEVKWSEYDRDSDKYKTGVEFIIINTLDIERIKGIVNKNQKGENSS